MEAAGRRPPARAHARRGAGAAPPRPRRPARPGRPARPALRAPPPPPAAAARRSALRAGTAHRTGRDRPRVAPARARPAGSRSTAPAPAPAPATAGPATPEEHSMVVPGLDEVTDETFATEVLAAEGPVLVDFTADWCAPCRMVAPVLSEIAREEAGRLRVVTVDVDRNPETQAAYGVLSMPTLMVFRGGEPVKTVVGARAKARLLRDLADVL
ncbi:thioredoxin [Kitasatospora sp. NPDC059571]|uniref:thioredoxin n=1 Tax=Kitasatospora sp. NPDC059571 TaxID=3346871 RepID=UPI0036CF5EF3